MPKFYCEYCGIYLTHSSPAGRKQHNLGRKHINAKVDYYQKLVREHFYQPPPYMNPAGAAPGAFPPIMPGSMPPPSVGQPAVTPQAPLYDGKPPGPMMHPAPPMPGPPSHMPPQFATPVPSAGPPNPPYVPR